MIGIKCPPPSPCFLLPAPGAEHARQVAPRLCFDLCDSAVTCFVNLDPRLGESSLIRFFRQIIICPNIYIPVL